MGYSVAISPVPPPCADPGANIEVHPRGAYCLRRFSRGDRMRLRKCIDLPERHKLTARDRQARAQQPAGLRRP